MDLTRITTGQLHAMHVQAAADTHAALSRAESAGTLMADLAVSGDDTTYAAAAANFRILLARAAESREQSGALYREICRRTSGELAVYGAMHGGRTGNGDCYCRTCGFTDCPGATGGDCPRWAARDAGSEPRLDGCTCQPIRGAHRGGCAWNMRNA